MIMPTFKEFLSEGALTNYRSEKEGMKLTKNDMSGSFEEVIIRLIKERIPFYFDCVYNDQPRIGYLMHKSINNTSFGGFIFDDKKTPDNIAKEFSEKMLDNIMVEKPGKLHIGRTNFSDLTKAADLDTISVVVKAFKNYSKEKNLTSREVTGNKYEANISIDFLCDRTRVNDVIDYVF